MYTRGMRAIGDFDEDVNRALVRIRPRAFAIQSLLRHVEPQMMFWIPYPVDPPVLLMRP